MAVKPHQGFWLAREAHKTVWENLLNGDNGLPASSPNLADKIFQITGTFGTGGTIVLEGSNDGINYNTLTDTSGDNLTFNTEVLNRIAENPQFIRPRITAGDGSTDLTVTLIEKPKNRRFIANVIAQPENDIGTAGALGFGVGIYPGALPSGMSSLSGTSDIFSGEYGNYQYADGSIMVWVPAFYYKMTAGNIPLIASEDTFASEAEANAAGYALHRAFYDGGSIKRGFFVDKYMCSKRARGTGFVASSVKNGLPLSTSAGHNPIADITASGGLNIYAAALDAVKGRADPNGTRDAASPFFCCSRQIYGALNLLALAHGQAATSTADCAWYDGTGVSNFPKGCNNNALGDANDAEIAYVSDGYSNCGKTGSGTPFAKTTHNGQASGVADLNGLMWEISTGITCVASDVSITGITQANPAVVTATGHGRTTGDSAMITGVVGMTEVNDRLYTITVIDPNTLSLDSCNSTGFTAYTSGGTITFGDFHAAKTSTAMRDFTSGNASATDHWGATGVSAMMEPVSPAFETVYANDNRASQRFGDGAAEVFSPDVSGNGWALTGLGLPQNSNAISMAGANVVGQDLYYQYIRNELALLSCGTWSLGTRAGPGAANWYYVRNYAYVHVGFRAAAYL